MSIPLTLDAGPLTPADLARLSTLFVKSLFDFFACEDVELLPLGDSDSGLPPELAGSLRRIRKNGLPLAEAERQELLLPIWADERLCGLAIIRGGDQALYTMPPVWLDEQSHLISREFFHIKQSCHDPATGLLNGFHLRGELEALLQAAGHDGQVPPAALALLEVSPHNRDADRSLRHIVRAGGLLASMFADELDFHHLGAGVFALLWDDLEMDEARQLGDRLLQRLKREGFASARLGITAIVPHDPEQHGTPEQLLEQAWQALRIARGRGPFGLCGHTTSQAIENHPLRKTPESTLRKLRALWRGKNRFVLALLRMDQEPASSHFSKRLRSAVGQDAPLILVNQREAFLFLDDQDEEGALAWLADFRQRMEAIGGSTFSMGVACFPYHDFKKSVLPANCRKAMLHAELIGPDSLAVFDAVSLNISGDVHYNDGDLAGALAEYREGLRLDPANVNILNSMGVAYVQLNQPRQARACFEKALSVEPDNFMALFNLGFIRLDDGDRDATRSLWEGALEVEPDHHALLRHLGILYCRSGEYQRAREVLGHCDRLAAASAEEGIEPVMVARWLGRAHEGLSENRQAIAAYQRAVSGNPRDAGSLSRLGRLYAAEGQGLEIGLSLCRQAVGLDSGKAAHWYRLGWVQEQAGDLGGAAKSLAECLRLDPRHSEATALRAGVLARMEKEKRGKKKAAAGPRAKSSKAKGAKPRKGKAS
ncbi:MAG: tetratricopeptide repeat-containing diguanylate cyclase [Thermodesulfobacteriota bacterium]